MENLAWAMVEAPGETALYAGDKVKVADSNASANTATLIKNDELECLI